MTTARQRRLRAAKRTQHEPRARRGSIAKPEAVLDPEHNWPVCVVPRCGNRLHPDRYAIGHRGCVEAHPDPAPTRTLVPLPKGATVVGPKSDLKGAQSSHKTGVMADGPEWYARPGAGEALTRTRAAPRAARTVINVDARLLEQLRTAPDTPGGVFITGEPVLARAGKLGWVTHRQEPSRLTSKGLLARAIARNGRTPEPLQP